MCTKEGAEEPHFDDALRDPPPVPLVFIFHEMLENTAVTLGYLNTTKTTEVLSHEKSWVGRAEESR